MEEKIQIGDIVRRKDGLITGKVVAIGENAVSVRTVEGDRYAIYFWDLAE